MNTIRNKQTWSIGLLLVLTAFFCACTKEALKDGKYYYGKVSVTLAVLPGSPGVDILFNGEKLGTVTVDASTAVPFQIKANEPGKLSVYQSGTNVLIADTMINLSKNQGQEYRVANSTELGIKGWISSRHVSQDSISFQLVNKLSTANYPITAPDLYICTVDPATFEITSTVATYKGFKKDGGLTPVLTLPQYDGAGNVLVYIGQLRDPATGMLIHNKGLDMDLFPIMTDDHYKGSYFIGPVIDDPDSGFISTDIILL